MLSNAAEAYGVEAYFCTGAVSYDDAQSLCRQAEVGTVFSLVSYS